ncbi:MAG: ABC transporter ATP-binding protein [Actinomycetota bacterium]
MQQATSNGTVVAAAAVTRRYGSGDAAVDALRGVTVNFPRGQFASVMGPSGSGKSTLLHILSGLDAPTSGSVTIDGVALQKLDDRALTLLRRKKVGFIFQSFNLLPMLSAEENVELPLTIAGEKADPEWIDEVMASVGLDDRRRHRPSELSGGQQQRVAIARALVSRPAVVFADEPTGNLDTRTGAEILDLLHRSVADLGQTVVMVTHDARAAAASDRVVFLQDGRVVQDKPGMQVGEVLDTIRSLE